MHGTVVLLRPRTMNGAVFPGQHLGTHSGNDPRPPYGTRTSRIRIRDTETEGTHRDGFDDHGHEQKETRTPKFDYNEYSK